MATLNVEACKLHPFGHEIKQQKIKSLAQVEGSKVAFYFMFKNALMKAKKLSPKKI